MATSNIELLKNRDFGELISDSFVFVRQNLKPLVTCFFVFCGFFMVAGAITGVMQQVKMVSVMNGAFDPNSYEGPWWRRSSSNPFGFWGVEYFLTIFFMILNYIAMGVTVLSYVALYKVKGNIPPSVEEVWGYFKYFFMRVLGSNIVMSFLIMLGFILCVIPGIYLYPVLALVTPIIIFENSSFGYAFNKSFKLIKDNWWLTFGALFVMALIVGFASAIITMPAAILNMSSIFLGKGMHLSVTLTAITTILQHLAQVFYILPLVTLSLCYFNLSEKTENIGLLGRINQLGNPEPDNTNFPAEDY